MAAEAFLAVARIHKPHGLKGEALVYVLTDDPDDVLGVGRQLTPVDEAGRQVGQPFEIERSRRYHREWLIKFRGIDDRTALERLGRATLGFPSELLKPPRDDQLYVHEIPGADVVVDGKIIGVAKGLIAAPGSDLLEIDVAGKALLIPFRRPIVRRIVRASRQIELDPPQGLLDL